MKMIEESHRLIVFNSIHRVMMAEMDLKDLYEIMLIPVPRAISADCGMVLRIDGKDCEVVEKRLKLKELSPFSIYRLKGEAFELVGEFS